MGLKPPYPFIYKRLMAGKIIPFLGAGAPLYSRNPKQTPWSDNNAIQYLPTAGELAAYLGRVANVPDDDKGELTKMAQYYAALTGSDPLRDELRTIFTHMQPPTPLHEFLAAVPSPLLIVTTNYDDLMERAFDAISREYDVVVHVSGEPKVRLWVHGEAQPQEHIPDELDLDLEKRTVVYKMHGAIDRRANERGDYVITEDDYIEFLTRMTRGSVIPKIFAPVFKERPFLFLGYGLYDWNLRVILKQVQQYRVMGQVKSWAIETLSKPVEQKLWAARDVNLHDGLTLEQFLTELKQAGQPPGGGL